MKFPNRFFILGLISIVSMPIAFALDVMNFTANVVDLSQSDAVLYRHESIFLGLSCRSGSIGKLSGASIIKIGDSVTVNENKFSVGVIQVTKHNENSAFGKKGEFVCVLAPDEASLPYDNDCDALWVRAPNCRVLER